MQIQDVTLELRSNSAEPVKGKRTKGRRVSITSRNSDMTPSTSVRDPFELSKEALANKAYILFWSKMHKRREEVRKEEQFEQVKDDTFQLPELLPGEELHFNICPK